MLQRPEIDMQYNVPEVTSVVYRALYTREHERSFSTVEQIGTSSFE